MHKDDLFVFYIVECHDRRTSCPKSYKHSVQTASVRYRRQMSFDPADALPDKLFLHTSRFIVQFMKPALKVTKKFRYFLSNAERRQVRTGYIDIVLSFAST